MSEPIEQLDVAELRRRESDSSLGDDEWKRVVAELAKRESVARATGYAAPEGFLRKRWIDRFAEPVSREEAHRQLAWIRPVGMVVGGLFMIGPILLVIIWVLGRVVALG